MHWHASAKKIISDSPTSGVYATEPSGFFASRSLRCSGSLDAFASLPTEYTMPSVDTNTSRAANAPMMPTPIFQSKPSGRIAGSIAWPSLPPKLFSISTACLSAVSAALASSVGALAISAS